MKKDQNIFHPFILEISFLFPSIFAFNSKLKINKSLERLVIHNFFVKYTHTLFVLRDSRTIIILKVVSNITSCTSSRQQCLYFDKKVIK